MTQSIYQSPPVGQEISCVMQGLDSSFLSKSFTLNKIVKTFLDEHKFTVLNVVSHDFSPQGFTLIFLLSESHLAVHTYPEYNSLYFSFYSCRGENDVTPLFDKLINRLKPKEFLYNKDDKVPVQKKLNHLL